ncbi:MAG: hypothetical protein GY820_20620 [Gammaproteobacteria bacterium]|nr:hypothetical protein [Gammaproteobacteria bacterium]
MEEEVVVVEEEEEGGTKDPGDSCNPEYISKTVDPIDSIVFFRFVKVHSIGT